MLAERPAGLLAHGRRGQTTLTASQYQLFITCRYQQQLRASISIQAAWRGHQQRLQYTNILSAATALQSAYQGLKVRTAVKQSHAFAIFLQSCCRCRRARAAFLRLRQAAVVLQAAVRGWQARHRCAGCNRIQENSSLCCCCVSSRHHLFLSLPGFATWPEDISCASRRPRYQIPFTS